MQPSGRLIPGKQLLFILYGSPGGSASVQLAGATKRVILEEVDAGLYLGAYTIGKRDRIGADATALATLRSGNRFVSSGLDEPDKVMASASALPRVDRFAAARTQTPASRN